MYIDRLCLGNSEISVLHIDEEFNEITHFLKYIKSMTSEKHQENETEAGIKLTTLDISTPSMSTLLGFNTFEITSVYEALVQTWIAPLPTRVPSRARIALEKLLRDIAAEICLASHALYLGPGLVASEENTEGVSTGVGPRFDLPMRRRPSAASLGKGKEKELERSSPALPSSQVSEDVGFLPPSPFQALPTPEPTPSLHSRSSVSSFAGSEAAASQRLQAFAKITPQPSLPSKMSNLLGQWQLGADPAFYNWEAAQQTADSEDESENQSRAKQRQRQRNDKRRKRHKEHTVGPSSQPSPKRLGGSQPQLAKDTQEDSQRIESLVTNSQVEPGRFGGRPTKVKKSKGKNRPAGFK